jgi:hypothetical protein
MNKNIVPARLIDGELWVRGSDAVAMATEARAKWQPIESAPKDGSVVLLFARAEQATASCVIVGWWLDEHGWIALTFGAAKMQKIVPSHWMHRPAFPVDGRATTTTSKATNYAAQAAFQCQRRLQLLRVPFLSSCNICGLGPCQQNGGVTGVVG